jgi:hypothetical protein
MRTFEHVRCRPIAVLLLANQLACYAWTRQPAPVAPLLHGHHPRAIRVHRPDGTVTEIGSPRLTNDSIVGTWLAGWGPARERAVIDTAVLTAALSLTNGQTVHLLQPIIRHDSLLGYSAGFESRPAGVAVSDIRFLHLRLTSGDRVVLRTVTVTGDSLFGLAGRVGRPRYNEEVRVAVSVADVSWSEVHKMTEVGQGLLYGSLCIVGLIGIGVVWCASDSECLRY